MQTSIEWSGNQIALRRKSRETRSLTLMNPRSIHGLNASGLTNSRPSRLASYTVMVLVLTLAATGLFWGGLMFGQLGRPAVRGVFLPAREASLTAGGEALRSFLVGSLLNRAGAERRPGVTRSQPPGHRPRLADRTAYSSSARATWGGTIDDGATPPDDRARIQYSKARARSSTGT